MLSGIGSRFAQLFSCDVRSLAAMRIGLASIYLVDMVWRLKDLTAFYADPGVLPRDALLSKFINIWHVSLLFMNGRPSFALIVLLVGMLCGLLLLCGVYTRLMTVLCWVILTSFHNRNPMVLHGGDALLRLLLFWGMFLPLQARWSLDRLRARQSPASEGATHDEPKSNFVSAASIAMMVQVVLIYVFGVLQKSGKEWLPDGTAVYYALHLDSFATPLAIWFRQFPQLMRWSTYATFAAEALLPWLLFSPLATRWCRVVAVTALATMHVCFALFLELGNFPWVDACSFLIFVPTFVWDKVESGLRSAARIWSSWPETWQRISSSILERMPYAPSMNLRPSKLTQLLVAGLLGYVVAWNATTISSWNMRLDRSIVWIGHLLRLDQSWGMFAPYPMKDDGWFVIEGRLRDGTVVDVRAREEAAPSYDKPEDVRASFIDSRWRKYYMNLWMNSYKDHRLYFGRFLCRSWNRSRHDAPPLETFTIYYMREDTLPDYQPSTIKKVDIWRHNCFV